MKPPAEMTNDEQLKYHVRAVFAAYMLDAWHREGFTGSAPRDILESWLDALMTEYGDFDTAGIGNGTKQQWQDMLSEASEKLK